MDEVLLKLIAAMQGAGPGVANLVILYLWLKFAAYCLIPTSIIGVTYVIARAINRESNWKRLLKEFPGVEDRDELRRWKNRVEVSFRMSL